MEDKNSMYSSTNLHNGIHPSLALMNSERFILWSLGPQGLSIGLK